MDGAAGALQAQPFADDTTISKESEPMTLPTDAPHDGQPRAQGSAGSARTSGQQALPPSVSPDEIDFSRLMEEQFQIALVEEEEERAQERRQRLYLILGVAAVILILAFAVVATIFGWWPVVLDLVLVIVVLINGVMLGFLGWAIWTVIRTIREVRSEITPVISSLADTATTAQETAKSASSRFGYGPVVRTTTLLMSAAGVARTMLGPQSTATRAEARQQRRKEVDQQIAARAEQSTRQAQTRQVTP
jgi:hypothetical protein